MLDYVVRIKGEQKKKNKFVKKILYLLAHKRSDFDSFVVLNSLPQWRTVANLIKSGSSIVSFKLCNGYVEEKQKDPSICSF